MSLRPRWRRSNQHTHARAIAKEWGDTDKKMSVNTAPGILRTTSGRLAAIPKAQKFNT